MNYTRNTVVKQAKAWIGCNESDGTHKQIIDTYNAHKPLARGYKVKYTDAWCATFVSAVAIKVGYTEIIPTECGCEEMIALFKKTGCWVEDDSYVPSAGDIIFYDWQDATGSSGDNKGHSDHVGYVEKVNGSTITVIEGNKSNAVGRRTMKVNGKFIRGYGAPKYTVESTAETATDSSTATSEKTATDSAESFSKSIAGSYKTTTSLYMRNGAGKDKASMVILPSGTVVRNYGYYTTLNGVKWLYVQVTYKNVKYTGFCSGNYLVKSA